jgi:4-hydroxythreonine-4-phosphate dehydrogenase
MKIALAMGDPAGIGPETLVRAASLAEVRQHCEVTLFGDLETFQRVAKACDLPLEQAGVVDSQPELGRFFDRPAERVSEWGIHSEWAGQAQVASLLQAFEAAAAGEVDGVVFAPFNKHSLQLANRPGDETAVMRAFYQVPEVRTVTRWSKLLRATVVGHIPFTQIPRHLNEQSIHSALGRLERMLRRYGVECPRIGVAGLNPHAGDEGTLGTDEQTLIAPAIASYAARSSAQLIGPYPPDAMMPAALRGRLDGLIYLYHDQGNIAMKAVGFGREVVFYPELPVVVATVAHGTAYDIAGKGLADPANLVEAITQSVALIARDRSTGA